MKIETWKIGKVKPYENNPRSNDGAVEATAQSIEVFGFRQPIVVDSKGVIICGHTRLKAAQHLGLKDVPVHVADLDAAQSMAYRIADNKTGELAEWDEALLAKELQALESMDFESELTGFDMDEIREIYESQKTEEEKAQDNEAADELPTNAPAVCQLGQLWKLGEHRLMCGDSTNHGQVSALMGGGQADMVLTDPPYGVAYVGKTAAALTIQSDDVSEEKLSEFCTAWFDNAQSVSRPGAYWVATVPAGPLHGVFFNDWKRREILRQVMVWVKDSMVLGHSEYHYRHEPILFGWVPGGDRLKNTDRTKTTVWEFARPKKSELHPTMKPVEMWCYAIEQHTRVGDTVYEPFSGSGTTHISCEKTSRRCFGMELDPKYCDVIIKRWEDYTGKTAELISD